MEIYIEIALLNNFIIDYVLLYSTSLISKCSIKKNRLLIGSAFACIIAIIYPLINISGIFLILTKITFSIFIIFITFGKKNRHKFFLLEIVFLFLTFLLGGIIIGLSNFYDGIIINSNGVVWNNSIPLSLVILGIFLFLYFGNQIYKYILKHKKISQFYYEIKLCFFKVNYKTTAYLDTANYAIDKKNNSPIIIIYENTFKKIIENNLWATKQIYQNMRTIQISTLSNNIRQMPCFSIDEIVIYSNKKSYIHKNITLAISDKEFKQINAEVILSPYLF